jgi:hypothetical protein
MVFVVFLAEAMNREMHHRFGSELSYFFCSSSLAGVFAFFTAHIAPVLSQ